MTQRTTDHLDLRDHLGRAVHGLARQPRRVHRDPRHPRRPRRIARQPRVDRQRIHADVRRPPADGRRPRRPLRPAAHVRDRRRDLHARLRRRCARAERRGAEPRARRPGPRRRDRDAADADHPVGGSAAEKRGVALGAWGGIGGLAIAFGPVVGGAVVEGFSWQWIFWLNVPIGILLVPLALTRLRESHGPAASSTSPGSDSSAPACSGSSGACPRQRRGLAEHRDPGVAGSRGGARRRIRPLGAPRSLADAADPRSSATVRSRSRTSRRCSCSSGCSARSSCSPSSSRRCRATRRCRLGAPHPPLDTGPDVHRAGRGRDVRPHRAREILGTGLTLQAVALAWIASVSTPTTPYSPPGAPVHHGRGRDGALLRADGQCRALAPSGRSRRARRPAPTTRSASSAVYSVSRCWPRSSRTPAATRRRTTFVDGMSSAVYVGAAVVALGAIAAFLIPRVRREHEARRRQKRSPLWPTRPERGRRAPGVMHSRRGPGRCPAHGIGLRRTWGAMAASTTMTPARTTKAARKPRSSAVPPVSAGPTSNPM